MSLIVSSEDSGRRSWASCLIALAVFFVLSAVTVVVWRNEIEHDRQGIRSHSIDVCRQASRRLETMVESNLISAGLFAQWVQGDHRRSRDQVEFMANAMIADVPGFRSVHLIFPEGVERWAVPAGSGTWSRALEEQLLVRSKTEGVLLSGLIPEQKPGRLLAVLPIDFGSEDLGNIIVELDLNALIDHGFRTYIRSEFSFEVREGDETAFQFTPEGSVTDHPHRNLGATWDFSLFNRTWQFEVVPRHSITSNVSGLAGWPVLSLGILLSGSLALLVHILVLRMGLLQEARDQALAELTQRKQMEEALRASEELYRGVFDSATDGLLLINDDDRILQANPAACRMHGWQVGELDGVKVQELIASASWHLYQTFKNRPEASGVFRADALHERKDGSLIDVEVRGSRFRMGSTLHMLVILTDVTERNQSIQRLGMLSRKALMAQEDERARVSRDLHDELGQLLTASRFELGWLQKHTKSMPTEASHALDRTIEAVEKSADELRRICRGLRPPLLDDLGLEPAVHLLSQEFEERTGMKLEMETNLGDSLHFTKEVALCTYRVLQESLNNVSRHANANSVDVSLVTNESELVLSVYDDGKGFDTSNLAAASGVGITGMRERASLVGGLVEVRSARSQGTRVVLRIPLSKENVEDMS